MGEENEWTMESMDISGVGRAPFITFTLSEDKRMVRASPPGGYILITAMRADGSLSRIELTNALTGEKFSDVDSRHVVAPSVGEDWNEPLHHATEIAAALYWSMWRMQQLKAATPKPESEEP
jgi:hypothetical protein